MTGMKKINLSAIDLQAIEGHVGKLTEEEKEILKWSYASFPHFVFSIYKWAIEEHFGKFIGGQFVVDECKFLQDNHRTITIEPRGHFKSMRFYAYVMWHIWRMRFDRQNMRCLYFSYRKQLADEHLKMIKALVNESCMPELGLVDKKGAAETISSYTWRDSRKFFNIRSYGLLEFSRGAHAEITLVDDPLRDEGAPGSRSNIWKINYIFTSVVMNIPTKDGVLHVIGTPQTNDDFFFDPNIQKEFVLRIRPAILFKDGDEMALWPEMYSLKELKKMRESRKVKLRDGCVSLFEQEYMCQPLTTANSYFDSNLLKQCVDETLENYDLSTGGFSPSPGGYCLAGYDPGKRYHPAHFVVLEIMGDGRIIQRVSKWFDDIDYSVDTTQNLSQFTYITRMIQRYNITQTFADNTRGELQMAVEQELLPGLVPVFINQRKKIELAQAIDSAILSGKLRLLNDERQTRQLLSIQADLTVPESSEGHGEPLTTLGLPLAAIQKKPDLRKTFYLLRIR